MQKKKTHVSIEVQMGIFTGETTKFFFFYRGLGLQLKNKGFPQK